MYKLYNQHLSRLLNTGKHRKLPEVNFVGDKPQLDFSTNDYLSLSKNVVLIEAASKAAKIYGVGATGSRLLSGNNEITMELESQIAKDKCTDAALIFSSGFQTNMATLSCLLDQKILNATPLVFFDKLNHASLYQAIFLSGAELVRYQHNNMEHLENLLKKHENVDRPKFIVAETVFGMDGDILPIKEIALLAQKHKALLYLDEAHALGVFGPDGYGLSTTIDFKGIPHLAMGTFSKALGCSGGYVACDKELKDYIVNKASGFIYSTANSPMIIGAAKEAWKMVRSFEAERLYLLQLAATLRKQLSALGFNIGTSTSHIIPIILGSEEVSMRARDRLLENGIVVSCIRPPTVPPSTSRIRIALNVSHTQENINQLVNIMAGL